MPALQSVQTEQDDDCQDQQEAPALMQLKLAKDDDFLQIEDQSKGTGTLSKKSTSKFS